MPGKRRSAAGRLRNGIGLLAAIVLLTTGLVVAGVRLSVHDGAERAPTAARLTSTEPEVSRVVVPGHAFRLRRSVLAARAARAAAAANPLVGGPWGVYRGPWNGIYPAYQRARGSDRAALARIALQPRVLWFTGTFSTRRIGPAISSTIKAQQRERGPDTLVQLALFREWVGGENARGRALSGAQQRDYRAWIDAAAAAIGSARTAIVLEPDLGLNAPPNNSWETRTKDPATRLALVRYAAQRLSALPRTTVYLDASDSDWLSMAKIIPVLVAAGVQYTRGFALGATHYSSVQDNLAYGAQLLTQLAARGITGKHFVIDTADNGRPFTWMQNRHGRPKGPFDNPATCATSSQTQCDTLGIPPTTTVTDPRLRLTSAQATIARQYVDGYLWFGRPWLVNQASPFSLTRSLQVGRTTPYQ